jgi:hypothetical protein
MKVIFNVEKSDLVGCIKDFPIEIVEKMVEEQVKQGNKPDVEVFQKYASEDATDGGFNWGDTEDGMDFWIEVIGCGNFEFFFEKYHRKSNVYIVGDSECGRDIIKTLEKHGGINRHNYIGDSEGVLYYINPNNNTIEMCGVEGKDVNLYEVLLATYTCIEVEERVLEVTMDEIAEKFGVEVSNLRIKK